MVVTLDRQGFSALRLTGFAISNLYIFPGNPGLCQLVAITGNLNHQNPVFINGAIWQGCAACLPRKGFETLASVYHTGLH